MKSLYKNTLYAVLVVLVVSLLINYMPGMADKFPVRKGLDLSGGTRAVLQLKPSPGVPVTREVQSQVVQIMTARVNGMGVSEALVQAKGADQIIVEMPQMPGKSVDEQRETLRSLIRPAKLEFIWLEDVKSDINPAGRYEYRGGNSIYDLDTGKTLTAEQVKTDILYKKPANIIVTGADLKPRGADVTMDTGPRGGVKTSLQFNDSGRRKFADFTSDHVGALLAIVLNGEIQSAPRINSVIEDGSAVIEGASTTVQEARDLAVLLNAGALPVPLEELSSSSVEATLGQNALDSAIVGGIIGFIAVVLFMLALYHLPGLVAVAALIVYVIVTFTVFRLLGVTLSLPGIAGFILSIGMAVDANILIFERMKEEMRAGRTLHAAVDLGFGRAWTSIRDANIATIITCIVLGWYPGPIRGFAIVLALGVIVSLLTAVLVSRALLHLVVSQEWAHDPKFFRLGDTSRPGRTFNIMGRRPLWFAISYGLILIGWLFNGLHLVQHGTLTRQGIDFTGGAMITYSIPENLQVSDADVKAVFATNGLPEAYVQHGAAQVASQDAVVEGAPEGAAATSRLINVRTQMVDDAKTLELEKAMQAKFGDGVQQRGVDRVGPVISKELKHQAIMMILAASLLILLYLAYAFGQFGFQDGLRYGTAATISMIHDVFLIFGFMGFAGYFFQWELNSMFITAALTIIGYTNHDTIVVFDRIRENAKLHRDLSFPDMANLAINQTLGRSINTSLTTLLTLTALLLFGTKGSVDLKVFVTLLVLGIAMGVYSSIFFATPILAWLESRKKKGEEQARRPSAAETKTFAAPKPAAPAPKPAAPAPKPAAPATETANGDAPAPSQPSPAPRRPSSGQQRKSKRRF